MKKLLLIAAVTYIASCTKYTIAPKVAHVSATTYYLFPGATYQVVQAISDVQLPGDSATVEYKGQLYRTSVVYQLFYADTAAHVKAVNDVNGFEIIIRQ